MIYLTLWNPRGYITDMSKWHGVGVWSLGKKYYVLCKTKYNTLGGLFWTPAGSRFVKLANRTITPTPIKLPWKTKDGPTELEPLAYILECSL